MAWYCSGSTNTELIDNLSKLGLIKNERVKKAMMGVDRAHYAPSRPYSDSPQPIGHGATISAPHMHGHACEYLIDHLKPGSRVLDIGSGSGYLTHVLANLVTGSSSPDHTNGHVVGLDHIPELVELGASNMHKSDQGRGLLDTGVVQFVVADGRLGWKESAPYDAIHVGAAAETLHPVLIEQLRAPGRMFIPVDTENDGGLASSLGSSGGQFIWIVDKKADGSVHKEKVFPVSYVPLTDVPRT
ncbi:protein-L-isoaspartate O-methyltransferase [Aspergillus steynii IBT 23096]|uniref:Protein-L-isoaspartate O-methyltransferase n=1 Tax=Aspergillus steynii IBT 23096 TaxID=1392250 RepID=A0A2I2GFT8_9EURO|nr:protein-L-isoaspartate O-methyltransferase [Aspergillus steynii IBT 23096]PLB51758.1 protein-L-isoaspartate O-methyltransferase [Aspergillus steynii IBT 23096]